MFYNYSLENSPGIHVDTPTSYNPRECCPSLFLVKVD